MDEQSRKDHLLWRPGQVEAVEDEEAPEEERQRRQPDD